MINDTGKKQKEYLYRSPYPYPQYPDPRHPHSCGQSPLRAAARKTTSVETECTRVYQLSSLECRCKRARQPLHRRQKEAICPRSHRGLDLSSGRQAVARRATGHKGKRPNNVFESACCTRACTPVPQCTLTSCVKCVTVREVWQRVRERVWQGVRERESCGEKCEREVWWRVRVVVKSGRERERCGRE